MKFYRRSYGGGQELAPDLFLQFGWIKLSRKQSDMFARVNGNM